MTKKTNKAEGQSWYSIHAARGDEPAVVMLYGDIGGFGITANDFAKELHALGKQKEIRLHISSDGGDVFEGYAMYNVLRRNKAKKVVVIDGLAASMGSVIAMAGDEIIMPSNAQLMIHNPYGVAIGGAKEIFSFARALENMKKSVRDIYAERSGMGKEEVQTLMDDETWLTAAEAVELGLADTIEKPVKLAASVAARFDLSKFKNVPERFGRIIKETTMAKDKNDSGNEFEGEDTPKTEAEVRAEIRARDKHVNSMCALAGYPDMAAKLIEDDATDAEVLAALEKQRDEDKAKGKRPGARASGDELHAHNRGTTGESEQAHVDTPDVYARWNSSGKRKVA